MAEEMCPLERRLKPHRLESAAHDGADGTRMGEPSVWGPDTDEDSSRVTVRPVLAQVGSEGLANVWWQRQAIVVATLPTNGEQARSPVDVIKLQGDDLTGPQAKPCDQEKEGTVTTTDGMGLTAAIDRPLDLFWLYVFRYP